MYTLHVLLVLLLFLVTCCQAPTFVENPALMGLPGVIYIPPKGAGDLILTCSTQDPARITFRSAGGTTYAPGNGILNFTQVSETKIVLYVKNNDSKAFDALRSRDHGSFQCQAQDLTNSQINTTGKFEFVDGHKPTKIVRHSPSLNEISLGQRISLFCVTPIIRPPVDTTWEFQIGNSKPVQQISKNKTRQSADLAKLELTTFWDLDGRKEDNGTFLCIFKNMFGSVSTAMDVIVKYLGLLKISVIPPSHRVVKSYNVNVHVEVECNPAPHNISISHNGVLKKSEPNRKTLDYDFQANLSDTGRYVVRVTHVSGIAQESFTLTVISSPSMVNFIVDTVTHHSVTYNWTIGVDGNADITKITLCCEENANDVDQNQCSTSAKSHETDVLTSFRSSDTLEGLLPNTTYYCELFAMNEVGETSTGFPQLITTKATVPSKPNITSCISRHEMSLTVNWTTFNGGNTITRYIIRYQVIRNIEDWINETQTEGISQSEGSTTLMELKKLTEYSVEVAAENSVGRSLFGQTENGQCLTTCDLLAPELNDTGAAIKGGYAIQLYVEDNCGNVTEFLSKSCAENSLRTTFRQLSSHTFWVNVTGLETGQRCIMIEATTDSGISSKYGTFKFAEQVSSEGEGNTVAIVASILAFVVVVVIAVIAVLVHRRSRDQGTYNTASLESEMTPTKVTPTKEAGSTIDTPVKEEDNE